MNGPPAGLALKPCRHPRQVRFPDCEHCAAWPLPQPFRPPAPAAPAPPPPPAAGRVRRGRCLHLGPRVEFRPGCGGWNCLHACDHPAAAAAHPDAVPGGACQACPDWEAE